MEWLDTLLNSNYAWLKINIISSVVFYVVRMVFVFIILDSTERMLAAKAYWYLLPDWKDKIATVIAAFGPIVVASWVALAFYWVASYAF